MPFFVFETVLEIPTRTFLMLIITTDYINTFVTVHNSCISFRLWYSSSITSFLRRDLVQRRILFGLCSPAVNTEYASLGSDHCAGVLFKLPVYGQLLLCCVLFLYSQQFMDIVDVVSY